MEKARQPGLKRGLPDINRTDMYYLPIRMGITLSACCIVLLTAPCHALRVAPHWVGSDEGHETASGTLPDSTYIVDESDTIYLRPDSMPQFPGGADALLKFLSQNVKYPQNARKRNIQGTVYATFVVEPDGAVSSVEIFRSADATLDDEVLRVLRLMPGWQPGRHANRNVACRYYLPVRFTLAESNYKPRKKRRNRK
jgi:TonB family protein